MSGFDIPDGVLRDLEEAHGWHLGDPVIEPDDVVADQLVIADPLPSPDKQAIGQFHAPDAGAPTTERLAAVAQYPKSGTDRRRVLDHIASCGERGATDEEVSEALKMRLYTAAPRRNELLRDGWLVNSGRKRPTSTGSAATVWRLSEAGRAQYVPAEN